MREDIEGRLDRECKEVEEFSAKISLELEMAS